MELQNTTQSSFGNVGAVAARIPMQNEAEAPRIAPKNAIKRDIPRYTILAGDLLIESKKRSFQMFADIELGGNWYPLRQIPCLYPFQGFVTRGRITPLLKTTQKAQGAEQIVAEKKGDGAVVGEGENERPLNGVFRPVFPYDSMLSLQSIGGNSGVVFVPELEGIEWNSGIVQQIQNFILDGWGSPGFALPTLLSEFESIIEKRSRNTGESLIKAVCARYIESANTFRVFANAEIDKNLLSVDQNRVQQSGHHQPITEQSRLYAAQLGRSLDADRTVVVQAQGTQVSDADRDLRERELAVRERELALKEQELNGGKPPVGAAAPQAAVETSDAPVNQIEDLTSETGSGFEQHVFSVGDTVLAGCREGTVTGKPGGRITVKFEDETKETFEKADVAPVNAG